MRIQILIGMIFLAPAMAATDTVYQWVGEDGNIHYSDKAPPPGTQVIVKDLEPIPDIGTVEPLPDSNITESENSRLTAEKVDQENTQLKQRRMAATTYEEALEIECGMAQGVIDKLSSGRSVSIASADGTTRLMSKAESGERIRVSQKYIDENCL